MHFLPKNCAMGKYLIVPLSLMVLCTFPLFAQDSENGREEEKLIENSRKTFNSLEDFNQFLKGCVNVDGSPSTTDPCNNLFDSACLKADKSFIEARNVKKEMEKRIDKAWNAAARAMGEEKLEKLYFDFIKLKGVNIKEGLSEEEKRELYPQDPSGGGHSHGHSFIGMMSPLSQNLEKDFEDVPEVCRNSFREIVDQPSSVEDWAHQLTNNNETLKVRIDGVNSQLKDLYKKEPLALVGDIQSQCSMLQQASKLQGSESTEVSTPNECKDTFLNGIRTDALSYFRKEGDPEGVRLGNKLVEDYFPALLQLQSHEPQFEPPGVEESTEIDEPIRVAQRESMHLWGKKVSACSSFRSQFLYIFNKYQNDFFKNVSASKPVIETMFEEVYSDKHKTRLQELYNSVHGKVVAFVEGQYRERPELKGTEKYEKMMKELKGMPLYWPSKPADSQYKTEKGFSLPVLDFDKVSETDMTLHVFRDPSLSFFKVFNAFYNPPVQVGTLKLEERVNLMPTLNVMAETDPLAVMAGVDHDIRA